MGSIAGQRFGSRSGLTSFHFHKYLHKNISTWSLLISNLVMIGFAMMQRWDILTIMWIYWFQSVTIGVFNFVRILSLKDFSTKGFKINNKPVEPTEWVKIQTAFFFLFHYGFFHVGYAVFLSSGLFARGSGTGVDSSHIFLTSAIFFGNHLFSFFYNRERDRKKENIGRVMGFPYARIIPMHLTIIFGSLIGGGAIILFLLLKTYADVVMHGVEHSEKSEAEKT